MVVKHEPMQAYEPVEGGVLDGLEFLRRSGVTAPLSLRAILANDALRPGIKQRLQQVDTTIAPGQVMEVDGGKGVGLFVVYYTIGHHDYSQPPMKIWGLYGGIYQDLHDSLIQKLGFFYIPSL